MISQDEEDEPLKEMEIPNQQPQLIVEPYYM
jgi:hypothetical protein